MGSGTTQRGGDDHLCFKDGSSDKLDELSEAFQLQRRAELGVSSHCLKIQPAQGWEEGLLGGTSYFRKEGARHSGVGSWGNTVSVLL